MEESGTGEALELPNDKTQNLHQPPHSTLAGEEYVLYVPLFQLAQTHGRVPPVPTPTPTPTYNAIKGLPPSMRLHQFMVSC